MRLDKFNIRQVETFDPPRKQKDDKYYINLEDFLRTDFTSPVYEKKVLNKKKQYFQSQLKLFSALSSDIVIL